MTMYLVILFRGYKVTKCATADERCVVIRCCCVVGSTQISTYLDIAVKKSRSLGLTTQT